MGDHKLAGQGLWTFVWEALPPGLCPDNCTPLVLRHMWLLFLGP